VGGYGVKLRARLCHFLKAYKVAAKSIIYFHENYDQKYKDISLVYRLHTFYAVQCLCLDL